MQANFALALAIIAPTLIVLAMIEVDRFGQFMAGVILLVVMFLARR